MTNKHPEMTIEQEDTLNNSDMKTHEAVKKNAQNHFNMILETIDQQSDGNEYLKNLYLSAEVIKLVIKGLEVQEVIDVKSKFSNGYLRVTLNGNEYILRELVVGALLVIVNVAVKLDIDLSDSADIALTLLTSLHEYLEITSSKSGVIEGMKVAVNQYLEAVIEV